MKTKHTKIDRSAAKWLPGAMALAATTASSQAANVQITLTENKISSIGGNQLVADLTGDNVADMSWRYGVQGNGVYVERDGGKGKVLAFGGTVPGAFIFVDAKFEGAGVGIPFGTSLSPMSISYLNPVTFSDARINGGSPTGGWLQVNAFNTSATSHTVQLSRLIFDNASTTRPGFSSIPGVQTEWQVSAVPEPGSNLALLALGAGGLTLRRRLKRSA
jgi:hypothetical protein